MKFLLRAVAMLTLVVTVPAMAGGDAAAGEAKSAICAACHGVDGNSTVAMWPKIAGQHAQYTERQLKLMKSGARQVPEMMGIVAGLDEQDFADLAAYYATQSVSPGVADPALVELGERIYRAGIPKREVPACMSCHGPAGEGNPLTDYPALAGQHAQYVADQLRAYRKGYEDPAGRTNDGDTKIMRETAFGLSDAEIEAVSSYVAGLK